MITDKESEIIERIKTHLTSISIDFDKFCDLLQKHNAFISGSYLLDIIKGELLTDVADIDIYVISNERSKILEQEIYQMINTSNNIHAYLPAKIQKIKDINDENNNDCKNNNNEKKYVKKNNIIVYDENELEDDSPVSIKEKNKNEEIFFHTSDQEEPIDQNEPINQDDEIIDIDDFEKIKKSVIGHSVTETYKQCLVDCHSDILSVMNKYDKKSKKYKVRIMSNLTQWADLMGYGYSPEEYFSDLNDLKIFFDCYKLLLDIKKEIPPHSDQDMMILIKDVQRAMVHSLQFKKNLNITINPYTVNEKFVCKPYQYAFKPFNFHSVRYTDLKKQEYMLNPNINFVVDINSSNKLIATHQLIYFSERFTPQEIVDNFDMDFCSNYFDGRNVYIKNYSSIVNSTCIMTLEMYNSRKVTDRIDKYINRGYSIKINFEGVIYDLLHNGQNINQNSTNFALNIIHIDPTLPTHRRKTYDFFSVINQLPAETENILLTDCSITYFNQISKKINNLPTMLKKLYVYIEFYKDAECEIVLPDKLPFGCEVISYSISNEIYYTKNYKQAKTINDYHDRYLKYCKMPSE
jgi:hypothetical protein